MKKLLIILFFAGMLLQKAFGQESLVAPYSERDYGTLATTRNYPYYYLNTAQDSILTPCRRLTTKPFIFIESNQPKNISGFKDKSFNLFTNDEKEQIIINAWHTQDKSLLSIIHKIAISDSDTTEELKYLRELSVMCLSVFNTEASKDILLTLVKSNDKEIGKLSAFSLVQLGLTNIGFKYIENWYNTYSGKNSTISALMIINTPPAIGLLKKMADDKDPSYALDASAALSLLGYCDFAFQKIVKFKDYDKVLVRQMVAWCLAYYIGTPEAIEIIKSLKDDPDHFLKEDQDRIFKLYKLNP